MLFEVGQMRVFISYASEDYNLAKSIQLALVGEGHLVFFDLKSIVAGDDFRHKIRSAILKSDVMIFLVSHHAIAADSFAMTELAMAEERWPHPKGRVVPVNISNVAHARMPPYLAAVSIHTPAGDPAASVAGIVRKLQTRRIRRLVSVYSLMGVLLGAGVLGFVVKWCAPKLLRLDLMFPTSDVRILDDFVFVHFQAYQNWLLGGEPVEIYEDPHTSNRIAVHDKATYVEHVLVRQTHGKYLIKLTSSGIAPEIKAINPPIKVPDYKSTKDGKQITAEFAFDQSYEYRNKGVTPSPKTVYVYRNGFQGRKSFGGKNVSYATDKLTFVYDFSAVKDWEGKIAVQPRACLKRATEEIPDLLDVKWDKGVAIVEAFDLKIGDKVRVFWTWTDPQDQIRPLTCAEALG